MQSDSTSLNNRQAALIKTIFAGATSSLDSPVDKGMQIYQNNLLMTAARVLSVSFPVIKKMLGEDTVQLLARHLLAQELPNSGDWADWGSQLPELIRSTPLHNEHPYLAETAELEWLLHQAARSSGTELDTASLSRLSAEDLSNVYLHLGKSVSALQSNFPVDELWRIHQKDFAEISSDEVLNLLTRPQQESFFLIYQKDHLPCIERLPIEEFEWITELIAGNDLASLLEQFPAFDFSQWLTKAIEQQWLQKLS